MISKLFFFDGKRGNNQNSKSLDIKELCEVSAPKNITSVSIPKFRVHGSFIEYVIECSKENVRWRVFRRYQQFKALDQKLKQLCTMSSQHHCEYGVLPVLSGIRWVGVTNHSFDLVEKRRRYLEIYLEQLLVPKNLFYVAKTALYNFLHDGEVPVECGTIVSHLVGFSAIAPLLCDEKENSERCVLVATETEAQVVSSAYTFAGDACRGKNNAYNGCDITKSTFNNNNNNIINSQSSNSSNDNIVRTEFSAHIEKDNDTHEKADVVSSFSFGSQSDNAVNAADECEDDPSGKDTDGCDLREPRPSPLCLHCNAEFSSMLYPHKCHLCKNVFCRKCLHVLELCDKGITKACMQCYENYQRRKHEQQIEKDIILDSLHISKKQQLRTDVLLSDFKLVTTLGRGTFGKVIKVIFRGDGKVYAMKIMNKLGIYKRQMIDCIREEKEIMETLPPHPFVVRCHFAFQTDYHLFFVLDYLPGGDLYSHLYPRCRLLEADICLITAELVLALEHLHRNDIVHRDLKPENIVLGADGHIKITDFGLARMNFSTKRRRSFVGSPEYLAPETIQGEYQTRALDWWSLGVMLYEMLSGIPPFHAANNNDVYNNVLSCKLDFDKSNFTPEAASLIRQLLQRQPSQRLSFAGRVKTHPYFASINWTALEKKLLPSPVKINLDGNDTKYFKRECTAEWAVIARTQEAVSGTMLNTLTSNFSNFVYVLDVHDGEKNKNENGGNKDKNQSFSEVVSSQPQPSSKEIMTSPLNPQSVLGLWRLLKVEVAATNGMITYPWGSDVCGLLAYFPDGTYTMQLSVAHGRRLRNHTTSKLTGEELKEVYNSYIASFGKYGVKSGSNSVAHCPISSLCPTFTRRVQKYFIDVSNEKEEDKSAVLRLSTAAYEIKEVKLFAKTVLTWEKVGKF